MQVKELKSLPQQSWPLFVSANFQTKHDININLFIQFYYMTQQAMLMMIISLLYFTSFFSFILIT